MGAAVFFMSTDSKGDLLVDASKYDNLKLVKRLTRLQGVPKNHPHRKTGLLALVEAAKNGNMDIAKELLMHGASINAADKKGATSLMGSLQKNRRGMMEMCLQLGVDFSLMDDQGRTALSLAVQSNRLPLVKRLLDKYPDFVATVDVPDVQGRTPIIWAAVRGNLEMAGLLVDYNTNVSHQDVFGKDAADYAGAAGFVDLAKMLSLGKKGLMIIRTDYFIDAVEAGDMPRVEELLKKDVEINRLHSESGAGAVHKAAETNNIEMFEFLLSVKCEKELPNKFGETPVVVASLHECTDMVMYLMGKRVNMHARSFDGLSPFQISAKYGFPEMMKALFVEGGVHSMPDADLKKVLKSCHERTSKLFSEVRDTILRRRGDDLVNTCEKGLITRVERLITIYGADANHCLSTHPPPPKDTTPTYFGRTPIIAAAEYGNAEICVTLIKLGAELGVVDMFGENALMKASFRGKIEAMVALLLEGANIKYCNEFNGKTAIHYAAEGNQSEAVIRLLQFGADPNCLTHGAGFTPLMTACLLGSTDSTRALIAHGAHIDAFDANRTSALMHAAGNGNDECVRALIDAGADITPENYFANTALQLAMFKQRVGCIRLLLAATNRARDKLGDDMVEAIHRQDRVTVRNSLHYGAYPDHVHTVSGVEAFDAAMKVGFLVNIELLRGAKRTQQLRTLTISFLDACKRGNVNQLRRMVELNHFDPHTRLQASGSFSLCVAAEFGHVGAARYLAEEAKVDLEHKTLYEGRTALICATLAGQLPMVQYLISAGALPLNIDMAGLSALDYAVVHAHKPIENFIRMAVRGRVIAAKIRRNLRLRAMRNDRKHAFVASMAARGVIVQPEEVEGMMKPLGSKRELPRTHSAADNLTMNDAKPTALAQVLGAFNAAGTMSKASSAAAGAISSAAPAPAAAVLALPGAPMRSLIAVAAAASANPQAVTVAADATSVGSHASTIPSTAAAGTGVGVLPHAVVAAAAEEDEEGDELVEQMDFDFSVRSPWMTEATDAAVGGAVSPASGSRK